MKRTIYTSLLRWKAKPKRKPLILNGARQVGKSYILKEFGEKNFSKIVAINFEAQKNLQSIFNDDLRPKIILNKLERFLEQKIDNKNDLLFFDEIQSCPGAITSLKYFFEEMPELHICSAGSLLGIHLHNDSFPVGKVDMLDMFPMTFQEFLEATKNPSLLQIYQKGLQLEKLLEFEHEKLLNVFKCYLVTGGMPEIVDLFLENTSFISELNIEIFPTLRKKQLDLIKQYQADFAKHSGKVNALHLVNIWEQAASQLSKTYDGHAPKFRFKDVVPKIRNFDRLQPAVSWLEAARLVIKNLICHKALEPLKAYTSENAFKLFIFDVGILNAMLEVQPSTILEYSFGTYKGFIVENFVAQELFATLSHKFFSWQENQSEIEFIFQTPYGVIPTEVKSGKNLSSPSLVQFEKKYTPKLKILVSSREFLYSQQDQKIYLPLYYVGQLKKIMEQCGYSEIH